jgi:uncharacterized phage-associated protein
MINKYKAMDVANYIIWYANTHLGNKSLTPIKLQKILYYVQATYLAKNGIPLFEDAIQKWQYGPVVPSVYYEFKDYGISHIDKTRSTFIHKLDGNTFGFEFVDFDANSILVNKEISQHIESIVDRLINERPFDLVNRTHAEELWLKDQEKILSGIRDIEYSNFEITEYFRKNPFC